VDGTDENAAYNMDGLLQVTARGIVIALAVIVLLTIVGAIYQFLSEIADLKRYQAPGQLIDIGGRRLHLLCAGSVPGPTVVIEAGSGNDSTLWDDMVRRVSKFAHVCTYDRAGLGWSDPVSGPSSIDYRAADLHMLLTTANISGPFVLVGHSYGGYIIRRFAAAYPANIAGMVLVDAPEEEFSFAPEGLLDIKNIGRRECYLGWLTRLGLTRLSLTLLPSYFDPVRDVPAEVHGLMTALFLRTSRHFATADEMTSYARVPDIWRRAHGFGLLGSMPLVVVSRGAKAETFLEWQEAQLRLTGLSTASTHIVAEKSGHAIQFSEPGIIVRAIRRVLQDYATTRQR
jgi:pimeloyl-ACP methyl ester carboxylesterase